MKAPEKIMEAAGLQGFQNELPERGVPVPSSVLECFFDGKGPFAGFGPQPRAWQERKQQCSFRVGERISERSACRAQFLLFELRFSGHRKLKISRDFGGANRCASEH